MAVLALLGCFQEIQVQNIVWISMCPYMLHISRYVCNSFYTYVCIYSMSIEEDSQQVGGTVVLVFP